MKLGIQNQLRQLKSRTWLGRPPSTKNFVQEDTLLAIPYEQTANYGTYEAELAAEVVLQPRQNEALRARPPSYVSAFAYSGEDSIYSNESHSLGASIGAMLEDLGPRDYDPPNTPNQEDWASLSSTEISSTDAEVATARLVSISPVSVAKKVDPRPFSPLRPECSWTKTPTIGSDGSSFTSKETRRELRSQRQHYESPTSRQRAETSGSEFDFWGETLPCTPSGSISKRYENNTVSVRASNSDVAPLRMRSWGRQNSQRQKSQRQKSVESKHDSIALLWK